MKQQKLLINGDRLKQSLEEFASFGKTENNGVTRLALSEEDRQARNYFRSCCEALGMTVNVDDLGNMYATLVGTDPEKPPVVVGSHLDSVKKGGRFDGVLGVLAGLEVVRTIVEHGVQHESSIVIVNFTNEEGARFEPSMMCSGILSGKFEKETMFAKKDTEGISFEDALENVGYAGDVSHRLQQAKAFLELHIEQGPSLEREELKIGVVECVVGMVCYEVVVSGESNHAGTTPMNMRRDALFTATDKIVEAREQLQKLDDDLVYTMGRMNVVPNIHTVIPNRVVFSIEARHQDEKRSRASNKLIVLRNQKVTKRVKVRSFGDEIPYGSILKLFIRLSNRQALDYPYKKTVSGAGHDAQFIASYIPSAMVFVPSIGGKSHDEDEVTPWEDCERGVNVILDSVLTIAAE
ncbi:LOW QUALITY PROTEIN: beta-ureidopropionase [Geomicrobium sp. JCM 19037]|nr:LOW QUALITY PROTEIN: beta-ureidopropionase [Geomicrobium sp. JCM 19037]